MKPLSDLICLTQQRWGVMSQRSQRLMLECSADRRVFFVEAPRCDTALVHGTISRINPSLNLVVPHLRHGASADLMRDQQRALLMEVVEAYDVRQPILWFRSLLALEFASWLPSALTIYDALPQPSAVGLRQLEVELLARADLVFTSGASSYEARRAKHHAVHVFPSSVDTQHFRRAQAPLRDPTDQAWIARPRLGFYGTLDERIDFELLQSAAAERPDWQFVMIGPLVGREPASLPQLPNIHYLGQKPYASIPDYLSNWDVALLPYARNAAGRLGSATKVLEYVTAGKPVVSTPVLDVLSPYGDLGVVSVVERRHFVSALERALEQGAPRDAQREALFPHASWADTWLGMSRLIEGALRARAA